MNLTTLCAIRGEARGRVRLCSPGGCAGAGGLVTGQADLLRAAVTSIAVPSALVAFLLGMWLR